MIRVATLCTALVLNNFALAQAITVTNTFEDGQIASAAAVNQNFTDLIDGFSAIVRKDNALFNVATGAFALNFNTSGQKNIANGYEALFNNTEGEQNTAVGYFALRDSTVSGFNTAIGAEAMATASASFSTAVGHSSMSASQGAYNTAIGYKSLKNNGGAFNTAVGEGSLHTNEGNFNVAVGSDAMGSETGKNEGSFNIAVGNSTLNDNTLGRFNTAAGSSAMGSNTSGDFNTAYGASALDTNETGSNNTAVGAAADVAGADLTNATVIGAGAKVAFSNTVRLGNANVTQVRTSGEFFSAGVNITSDRRLKTDIAAITEGLALINDLKPVKYRRVNNISDDFEMGLLAQEVEEALAKHGIDSSGMVHQDSEDAPRYVRYTDLHAPVIRAIQELDDMMVIREQTIYSLQSQLDAQADKIKAQKRRLNAQREELLVIVQSQRELMARQEEQIAQLQRMVEHQFSAR